MIRNNRIYMFRDTNKDNQWNPGETGNAVAVEDPDNWRGWSELTLEDFDRADDTLVRYSSENRVHTTLGEFKNHQNELEHGGWIPIDGKQWVDSY